MKKILILIVLPVIFCQFFALSPNVSIARADGPADINNQEGFGSGGEISNAFGETDGQPADPRTIASNIIKVVLGLLAAIFIILLVYAGFTWMTSNGDEEKVNKAKDTIIRAVIGLAIIIASYGITIFVMNAIINASKPGLYQ